jgi:hypothetical protein
MDKSKALKRCALLALVVWLAIIVIGAVESRFYQPIGTTMFLLALVLSGLVVLFALMNLPRFAWFTGGGDNEARILRSLLPIGGGFAAAVVAGLFAASKAAYVGDATPAFQPNTSTDPTAQPGALFAFAETLTFDTNHVAADEQWLEVQDTVKLVGGSTLTHPALQAAIRIDTLQPAGDSLQLRVWSLGPQARILPEVNSKYNRLRDLNGVGGGRGRIVAKVWVDPAYRNGGGYPKLGLPPGTSYLWVDSLVSADTGSIFRAFVITPTEARRVAGTSLHPDRNYWSTRSAAKWAFHPNDPCWCESCMSHGWCRVCGPLFRT